MTKLKTPEQRRRKKQRALALHRGAPGMMDAAPVRQRIEELRPFMTQREMAERATTYLLAKYGRGSCRIGMGRVHQSTISNIVHQGHETCHHELGEAILAITPSDPCHFPVAVVLRRIHALCYEGFPVAWQAAYSGRPRQSFGNITSQGWETVGAAMAADIDQVFRKLSGQDPLQLGVAKNHVTFNKRIARERGWAPAHCWDDDTIDDPDAFPEWTGACGSDRGYQMHYNYDILPFCDPCKKAHSRQRASYKNTNKEIKA